MSIPGGVGVRSCGRSKADGCQGKNECRWGAGGGRGKETSIK